jgi:hypothetical protein
VPGDRASGRRGGRRHPLGVISLLVQLTHRVSWL